VLRNHLAETAIRQAKLGDFSEIETLHDLLKSPYDEHPGFEAYAALPPDWAAQLEISCSS
jgi:serine/tyrosine/threonine adenylyltransferase